MFKSLQNRRNRNSSQHSAFESLEARLCMSTTSYDPATRTLTITGTEGPDHVSIITYAEDGRLRVMDGNAIIRAGNNENFKKIVVDLKGGDDQFELTGGSLKTISVAHDFDIKLGEGVNVARIDMSGTTFYSSIINSVYGDWNINITGGSQRDDVTANLGRRTAAKTTLTAHLGGGTDFFTGSIDGNTDDGLTRMSVFGEAGIDTMTGGVTADTFDGGSDNDIIHGGAGNDKLFGNGGLDQLFGEDGNDSLDGGGLGLTNDRDILTGGAGRDIFSQYRSGPTGAFNQDLITDRESIDIVYNVGGLQTLTVTRLPTFA